MLSIRDKEKCCGCSACIEICPKKCIKKQIDSEGFAYPIIDTSLCINCKLCEKVCPYTIYSKRKKPKIVYAAKSRKPDVLKNSSSGGIFFELAQYVISKGGVVFGTKLNSKWMTEITSVESIELLRPIMGSKYIQSDNNYSYSKCLSFLKAKKPVLFSGTPCQIAGLKQYLRKDFENLLLVEVACHGAPSPLVWNKYLLELIKNIEINENDGEALPISEISFREKVSGWERYNLCIHFKHDYRKLTFRQEHSDNIYMKAFGNNLILRPACYSCHFKKFSSNSDLTLADFWGVKKFHPQLYDEQGVSLILVNSEKGKEVIDKLQIHKIESSYKSAVFFNEALLRPARRNKKRNKFFQEFQHAGSVICLLEKYEKQSKVSILHNKIEYIIKSIIKRIKYQII